MFNITNTMSYHFTPTRAALIKKSGNFPGGPVVKNPPSNARDVGLIPGQGTKIPHAVGQLSPSHTTTTESAHSGPCTPQLEKPKHHN